MRKERVSQSVLFDGIEPPARGKAARKPRGKPDPACERCKGTGVILRHSEWCRNDGCTIERHKGDCHGTRRRCRCWEPRRKPHKPPEKPPGAASVPDTDRPLLCDLAVAQVRESILDDPAVQDDLIHHIERTDLYIESIEGARLRPFNGHDYLTDLQVSLSICILSYIGLSSERRDHLSSRASGILAALIFAGERVASERHHLQAHFGDE